MRTPAHQVIAIDGPAASGKSSVARGLASRLGMGWVNSGAFYRAVTWWLLSHGKPPFTEDFVREVLERTEVRVGFLDGKSFLTLDGINPLQHLREGEVNSFVSSVSQLGVVRERVSDVLRLLACEQACVVEGRDIGTCVFPETPFKFYVDASPEERLRRRKAEGQEDRIAERDKLDSQRTLAPLVAAADAERIDSTHIGIQEVIDQILSLIEGRNAASPNQ